VPSDRNDIPVLSTNEKCVIISLCSFRGASSIHHTSNDYSTVNTSRLAEEIII